jgi:hypothetical protein
LEILCLLNYYLLDKYTQADMQENKLNCLFSLHLVMKGLDRRQATVVNKKLKNAVLVLFDRSRNSSNPPDKS